MANNMTFAQSVAAGRSQGSVSAKKADENYKKLDGQIKRNQPAQQSTPTTLPTNEPSALPASALARKTSKTIVQDDTAQRSVYLRSMDVASERSRLEELNARLSQVEQTRDAYGDNLGQLNRFLPGSGLTYQELAEQAEELQRQRNQLQQDIFEADYLQTSDRYAALKNSADYSANLTRTGLEPWKFTDAAAWATKDEADMFYYLRNTRGERAAHDYLSFMSDEWNRRSASLDAQQILNAENPVARALATGSYAVASGLDQALGGYKQTAENIFGEGKRLPTSSFQQASAMIRNDLGAAGRVGYDLLQTTANMIPSIAVSAMTGGAGAVTGAASMFANVYGNTYNQALQQGYNKSQANNYALISATSESALQYLLGGISALGGKATGSIIQRNLQNIRSAAGRVAAEMAIRMGGEFTEEYLQEVLDPVFRNLMLDENNQVKPVSEDAAYAGLLGALSAGLLESGGVVRNARNTQTVQPTVQETSAEESTLQKPTSLPMKETSQQEVAMPPGAVQTTNENGLVSYTPQEQTNLSSGKRNIIVKTVSELRTFISRALGQKNNTDRAYLGKIPDSVVQMVMAETGIDVSGYAAMINGDDVRHIFKEHGDEVKESSMGQTAVTEDSLSYLPAVLSDPDRVHLSPDPDGKGRRAIVFEKTIGDLFISVQGVSDGKRLLQTDTMYVRKKGPASTRLNTGNASPEINARSEVSQGPSEPTVSQPDTAVNPESLAMSDADATLTIPVEEAEISTPIGLQFFSDGEGTGPDIALTQSRSRDQTLTQQDITAMPGASETEHEVIHDSDSMQKASRALEYIDEVAKTDPAGAKRMLENYMHELATNDTWTPVENDSAFMIRDRMLAEARKTGDYNAIYGGYTLPEWLKLIDSMGTAEGQALHARRKWSTSDRDSIVKEAQKTIEDAGVPPEEQGEVIQQVDEALGEIESATGGKAFLGVKLDQSGKTGTVEFEDTPEIRGNLVDVIERIAQRRGITKTVLSGNLKGLHSIIRSRLLGFDAETLGDIAVRSALGIANDRVATNKGERLKTLQVLSHLFNPKTWARNIVGNLTFSVVDSTSNVVGTFFDVLIGKRTGTRSVTAGPNFFSQEAMSAKASAFWQSVCAVYLDVDMTGDTNRYGQKKSRTFRMNETRTSALTRTLSKLERNLSYALTSADQFSKGGIQATQTARIQSMIDEGKIDAERLGSNVAPGEYAAERGAEAARYRTFQDNSKLSAGAKSFHDMLNLVGIGSSGRAINGHDVKAFGLGDLLMPYPGVPGNIASRAVEYSPVGLANGIRDISKVLKAGKSALVSDQAKAVMELSRGITGSAMIGLFAMAAAKGIISSSDDDDNQDEKQLNKAEGLNGIQFNASAFWRMLSGYDTKWHQGDKLLSLDFLQPMNSWMALGCFVDSYLRGDQDYDAFTASVDAFGSSIEDFPVLQTIQNIVDDVRYGDTGLAAAVLQEASSSALSSVVPSLIRGIATGTDNTQRDAYSGQYGAVSLYEWFSQTTGVKSVFMSSMADFLDGTMKLSDSVSTIMAATPGLRKLLPQKLDNYGQSIGYTGNRVLDVANAVFLPGSVDTYRQRDVSRELSSVAKASGENSFYPNRNPISFVEYGGQRYSMTYDQQQVYQKDYGMLYYEMSGNLIRSQEYQDADAATKADMLTQLESVASAQARIGYMESIGVDYSGSDAAKLVERLDTLSEVGVQFPTYYVLKSGIAKIDNGNSETKLADKLNLLNDSGLDIQQQATVYYSMVSSISDEKVQAASLAGVDESTLELWSYRFKMMDELGDADNTQKRRFLMSSSNLSPDEKEALDDLLLNDVIVIPQDKDVEYDDEDSFYVSQMSDSGRKRYESFVSGQLSGEEWNRIYSACSSLKKNEIISWLIEDGWTQSDANTIYRWIKPTDDMKRAAGWE